jgi:hypothetical protein
LISENELSEQKWPRSQNLLDEFFEFTHALKLTELGLTHKL